MPTKAYSQATVDQMRADLRALDARVSELEKDKRDMEWRIRFYVCDFDIDRTEFEELRAELNVAKRKQRALAAKVARIEAAKEQG